MASNIPDPTRNLEWSNFDKPIHDVFAQNAEKHPDRICVTETSPWRQFTYKQLNQAANILAHHLVQSGIERGDVVMIYSARNVDLVVAVMGILRAGATFSVIDPQYPPDRQIIYLDVARPRALVTIQRAAEQAGGFDKKVISWIDENLRLKARIPALAMREDGSLGGGLVNGTDALEEAQRFKEKGPGIVVGPDSNPTLSFTSGSEGRPKGVLGRHFSLVYYQSWMAKRFGMTENERFTMLSGIAHDPIQRDMFTPLFLGAQIYIPSQEDIQFEKLAEWMRDHKCTVTHLTPAMGQILVGHAVAQFPTLKNAFFVGDVLIKRDVRRLQELAPNSAVINMFGTTETQRAVSYYAVPSRNEDHKHLDQLPDRIPAGQGMHNVQLLVVDRDDTKKLCPVGKDGEIYVRAAGLAEGYLGLDEYTREKFLPNWFIDPEKWVREDKEMVNGHQKEPWREFYKGPRDRLYKSGDLGHYTESGNVVCTGRADNQVKIRGFRVELGEIDTHLSAHNAVRENVTLVRRDENEEHRLVSYIVPEAAALQRFIQNLGEESKVVMLRGDQERDQGLRTEIKDHLRSKVPEYSVPTDIFFLNRMPLNPNGKIDKPALPHPSRSEPKVSQEQRPTNLQELTATESEVAKIWTEVLRMQANSIKPDDSFLKDLSGDSLKVQEMMMRVRRRWSGLSLGVTTIYTYSTLREFAAEIDRTLDPRGAILSPKGERDGFFFKQEKLYSTDAEDLSAKLPRNFPLGKIPKPPQEVTVLLTGATGFLGSFVLHNLLSRASVRVVAHVRAASPAAGTQRISQVCRAYGLWDASWSERLRCVVGDISQPKLGLSADVWRQLTADVDVVVHNGARVNWALPYSALQAANVHSTMSCIELAAAGKPKQVTFVSSTAVLDTDRYAQFSESIVARGGRGIPEDGFLEPSRKGLTTGYAQTKWASEYLMQQAAISGLTGAIVRPGYVLGDATTGASITDDFLIRLLRGCEQVHARPRLPPSNTVNMVPVNHVAAVVAAAALHPPVLPLGVVQVTPDPRMSFNKFLGCLALYGYDAPEVPYEQWAERVLKYYERHGEHALLPLLELVTEYLPAATTPRYLDDRNARAALQADGGDMDASESEVSSTLIGRYLAYLVRVGFMPPPSKRTRNGLPPVDISDEQVQLLKKIEGRAAVNAAAGATTAA